MKINLKNLARTRVGLVIIGSPNDSKSLIGNFKGSSDGFHKVESHLEDGKTFLRLENLKATNGSALYVYLSTDRDASDFQSRKIKREYGQ